MSADTQVGKLDIQLNADASRVSAAVDEVNRKLDSMMAKARSASGSISTSNAGLISSFEGVGEGVKRNLAAIDRLGAKTDELMGKQHTAWTAIGAVVGGTTQTMIQRITSFIDKTAQIPAALQSAMQSMNQDAWTKTDALRVANDQLEAQIALIEHKPTNNLALEFDEARVRADALSVSIQTINDRMDKALSANHIAGWKRLMGYGPTANTEGTIKYFDQKMQDSANERQIDLHDGLPLSAAADDKERRQTLVDAHRKYQEELARMRPDKDGKYNDNSGNRSMLLLADAAVVNQQDADKEGDRNEADQARLKRDQDAQRARAEAQAAQQKADQAQMASFRQQLSAIQQTHKLGLGEELAFWEQRVAQTKKGSANYIAIFEKLGALTQAEFDKMDEAARQRAERIKKWDEDALRLNEMLDRAERKAAEGTAAYNEAVSQNADAMQEMILAHDVAHGAVSRHDAAVQMATIHARTYAEQLQKLDDERKADNKDSSMAPEEREANEKERQARAKKITGEADRVAIQDNWEAFSTTGLGGATEALDQFIAATKDNAATMKSLTEGILSGFNATLLKQITGQGQRGDWGHLGQSVFSNIAGASLNKGEGMLLSGLGLGKADGSSESTALWTRIAGGAKSVEHGVGGFLGKIFGKSKGGDSDDSDSSDSDSGGGGSDGGGFGSILSNIVPFLASGGDFHANSMAVVGEKGPELVRFGRSGTVISNDKAFGGSGGDTHVHIDARGATDPAQIHVAVQRGILAAAPHLMKGSVRMMRDDQRRRPSSMR